MKKILGIILLAVVLAAAGFSIWYFTPLSSVPANRVLPAEPLLYAQFSDMRKHWNNFQKSSFHEDITKVNLNPLVRINPSLNKAVSGIKTLQDQLNTPDIREYLAKFLGREVTIAVYPRRPDVVTIEAAATPFQIADFPDIFLVSRVSSDLKWKELLLRLSSPKNSPEFNLEKVHYRGCLLYTLPLSDGINVVFTRIGDLFIAAPSKTTLQRSVDIYKDRGSSLALDEHFRSSLKVISPANSAVSVYWDTAQFFSMVTQWLSSSTNTAASIDVMKNFQGFTVGGASVSLNKELRIRNEMYFLRDELAGDVRNYIDACNQSRLESVSLAPKDVLWYQAFGCLHFKKYWAKIKEEIERQQTARDPSKTPERALEELQFNL